MAGYRVRPQPILQCCPGCCPRYCYLRYQCHLDQAPLIQPPALLLSQLILLPSNPKQRMTFACFVDLTGCHAVRFLRVARGRLCHFEGWHAQKQELNHRNRLDCVSRIALPSFQIRRYPWQYLQCICGRSHSTSRWRRRSQLQCDATTHFQGLLSDD